MASELNPFLLELFESVYRDLAQALEARQRGSNIPGEEDPAAAAEQLHRIARLELAIAKLKVLWTNERTESSIEVLMATLSLSLKHVPLDQEESCSVCRARFTPAEDSGSRLLSVGGRGQEPLRIVMCGGCYSKWSHGTTVAATCDGAPRSESLVP